jgi:hypothetical protein
MFVVGVTNDHLVEHSRQAGSSWFECPAGLPVAEARGGGSLFDTTGIRHRPLVPLRCRPRRQAVDDFHIAGEGSETTTNNHSQVATSRA